MAANDIPSGLYSIPWTRFSTDGPSYFVKRSVPYVANANALQTVDIWVRGADLRSTSSNPPQPNEVPEPSDTSSPNTDTGVWLVFIHGGAWRDTSQTSHHFDATVQTILSGKDVQYSGKVRGFASINYSLSTHVSPNPGAKDAAADQDDSLTATHPRHLRDVLSALSFLQRVLHFGDRYILLGHSCGATLSFQTLLTRHMTFDPALPTDIPSPRAVVGANGIYDLYTPMVEDKDVNAGLAAVYREFIPAAFGNESSAWKDASPTWILRGCDKGDIAALTTFVVAASPDDSLVPMYHANDVADALKRHISTEHVVRWKFTGDHHASWESGTQLAAVIDSLLGRL